MGELTFVPVPTVSIFNPILAHFGLVLSFVHFVVVHVVLFPQFSVLGGMLCLLWFQICGLNLVVPLFLRLLELLRGHSAPILSLSLAPLSHVELAEFGLGIGSFVLVLGISGKLFKFECVGFKFKMHCNLKLIYFIRL